MQGNAQTLGTLSLPLTPSSLIPRPQSCCLNLLPCRPPPTHPTHIQGRSALQTAQRWSGSGVSSFSSLRLKSSSFKYAAALGAHGVHACCMLPIISLSSSPQPSLKRLTTIWQHRLLPPEQWFQEAAVWCAPSPLPVFYLLPISNLCYLPMLYSQQCFSMYSMYLLAVLLGTMCRYPEKWSSWSREDHQEFRRQRWGGGEGVEEGERRERGEGEGVEEGERWKRGGGRDGEEGIETGGRGGKERRAERLLQGGGEGDIADVLQAPSALALRCSCTPADSSSSQGSALANASPSSTRKMRCPEHYLGCTMPRQERRPSRTVALAAVLLSFLLSLAHPFVSYSVFCPVASPHSLSAWTPRPPSPVLPMSQARHCRHTGGLGRRCRLWPCTAAASKATAAVQLSLSSFTYWTSLMSSLMSPVLSSAPFHLHTPFACSLISPPSPLPVSQAGHCRHPRGLCRCCRLWPCAAAAPRAPAAAVVRRGGGATLRLAGGRGSAVLHQVCVWGGTFWLMCGVCASVCVCAPSVFNVWGVLLGVS